MKRGRVTGLSKRQFFCVALTSFLFCILRQQHTIEQDIISVWFFIIKLLCVKFSFIKCAKVYLFFLHQKAKEKHLQCQIFH